MNEGLNPNVHEPPASEFEYETEPAAKSQLGENAIGVIKGKPAAVFSMLLVGSLVASLLIGYFIGQARSNARRQRQIEDWTRELTRWVRQHGGKIANPLKEGYEATRSAAEDVSLSGARLAQQLNPFTREQKRKFFGMF